MSLITRKTLHDLKGNSDVSKDMAEELSKFEENNKPEYKKHKERINELEKQVRTQALYLTKFGTGQIKREDLDNGLEGFLDLAKDILFECARREQSGYRRGQALIKMISDVSGLYLDNEVYKKIKAEEEAKIIENQPQIKELKDLSK